MASLPDPVLSLSFQFRERCHYCSRWQPKSSIMRFGGHIVMCHNCYEAHGKAIRAFAGTVAPECFGCLRTLEQLEGDARGDVKFHLHVKDGWFYQLLCGGCSAAYVRKRADLFGDTPYGYRLKLKGAK